MGISSTYPAGRIGRALGSWFLVVLLATAVAAGADRAPVAVGFAMGLIVLVHVVALVFARGECVGVVVLALGGIYVGSSSAELSTARVAMFAALLLVATELAFWSFERRTRMVAERGVDARRWLVVAALFPVALLVALMIMWIARSAATHGVGIEVVGVLASAGVIGVVALLTRPRRVSR